MSCLCGSFKERVEMCPVCVIVYKERVEMCPVCVVVSKNE